MDEMYGGIEFGGTKTICAIGSQEGEITAKVTIPTTTVESTLGAVYDFFKNQSPIKALGIGSFGPLNINSQSEDYGSIYNAPKSGWTNVNLRGLLSNQFNVPIYFDTDVNCSALGELYFGVVKEVSNFAYLTLGTGIGGSLIIERQLVHGILNLEMGHMRIPHEDFKNGFKGACNFHGDCLEGIAGGYAMQQHYGKRAEEIESIEAWDLEANHIAIALNNIIMAAGPEKIVLGGGLVHRNGLIEEVRSKLASIINDYLPIPDINSYIVASSGDTNGVLGAIMLAAKFRNS